MKTTLRTFLGGVAVASLSVGSAASALIAAPEESAHKRLDRLISEFKATVMEINPKVRFSEDSVHLTLDDESSSLPLMPLMIVAQWTTGLYHGDGTYSGGSKYDRNSRYRVKKLDYQIGGRPVYSVIPTGERNRSKWMKLSEARFESFIGRKLA